MHRHKKKWGQVFLKNKAIQQRIADYVNNLNYINSLEIGPGDGAITQHLVTKDRNVLLVEIDPSLIAFLKAKFPETKVIFGDFLVVDIDFGNNDDALVFGNIPYNITAPIIFRFLKTEIFKESVLMVQKECFDTIVAKVGSREYSSFSALIQSFCDVQRVIEVGRKNFFPIPAVDSAVIHFKKKHSDIKESEFDEYALFLRKSFSMPRKTLWNNFRKFLDIETITLIFEEQNIDKNIRPEAVSSEVFSKIFLRIFFEKNRFHSST